MSIHISSAFSLKELRPRKNKKSYNLPISDNFDVAILKDKHPESFVFTNRYGLPYSAWNLIHVWHKARKEAKIPHITLYNATRHSIASQAVNSGVGLEIVSKALGHSTTEMTKKYASMNIEMLKPVINGTNLVQISKYNNKKINK